jgi:hypothetical protein
MAVCVFSCLFVFAVWSECEAIGHQGDVERKKPLLRADLNCHENAQKSQKQARADEIK